MSDPTIPQKPPAYKHERYSEFALSDEAQPLFKRYNFDMSNIRVRHARELEDRTQEMEHACAVAFRAWLKNNA